MAEGWARRLKGDVIEPYSAGIVAQGLNPSAVKVMAARCGEGFLQPFLLPDPRLLQLIAQGIHRALQLGDFIVCGAKSRLGPTIISFLHLKPSGFDLKPIGILDLGKPREKGNRLGLQRLSF